MNSLTQFGAFCLVGCANTAIDCGVFNLLTRGIFRSAWIMASIISCSAAMGFSFVVNLNYVFPSDGRILVRGGAFLAVTLFSSYGIQSAVIHFARRWRFWHGDQVLVLQNHTFTLSADLLERNKAKLLAVAAGMLWNFFWYKFYVFA